MLPELQNSLAYQQNDEKLIQNEGLIDSELLTKLQEFCKSENREELIQQIPQSDLIQLCLYAA